MRIDGVRVALYRYEIAGEPRERRCLNRKHPDHGTSSTRASEIELTGRVSRVDVL